MKFLHIEDNENDREILSRIILSTEGYRYAGASSLQEGLALWEMDRPDVVLIDLALPDATEDQVMRTIERMALGNNLVIPISGQDGQRIVNLCYQHGAGAFMNKNDLGSAKSFKEAVQSALRRLVARGMGDSPMERMLKQINDTLYVGNGKPSVLARLEQGDEKMAGIALTLATVKSDLTDRESVVDERFDKQDEALERIDKKAEDNGLKSRNNFRLQMFGLTMILLVNMMKACHGDKVELPEVNVGEMLKQE